MADGEHQPRVTLEQLHDQLRAAVEAIETGDQWKAWLDLAGRLHRYSFGNLMLIMTQRPDATAVASYTTWKAAHRQVLRGERGIKVMAPITRRTEVTDEHGKPKLDADGHKRLKRRVVGYRPVSVFDISQTSGPPIAEPAPPTRLEGSAPAGLWDSLAREVTERGYRLLRTGAEQLGTANGVTLPTEREVWIRVDVDEAQAVKTLAHELAHVILHTGDSANEPCRGVKEVEAESVAYLTLAAHGVASDSYSFPYVTHWAYPIAAVEHVTMADIVTRTGQRVTDAARTIIDATQSSQNPDPASAALVARARAAAESTSTLREDVEAAALAPVERAVLLAVVADSDVFFRSQVDRSWVPTYLDARGLGSAIRSHGVGYAPKGWTTLTDHLQSLGYSDAHIEAAGMATRARTGRLVDRFRDRLTVPLRDDNGQLVGFTARLAPDADQDNPKYLNTPATAIFKKGELLYGVAEHRDALRAGALPVVCEGPLDAIAVDLVARKTGTKVVGLASCGTAFSDAHAQRLAPLSVPRVCLAFDGDDAGRKAAERAWTKITNAGTHDVTIAELPPGTDPASVAVDDPAALARHVTEARSAAIVLADQKINIANLGDNTPRRYALFRDLIDWTEQLPVEQRVDLALHVARRLGIDPSDAAHEIAERRPDFMADATSAAVIKRCAALTAALDDHVAPTVDGDPASRASERTHDAAIAR